MSGRVRLEFGGAVWCSDVVSEEAAETIIDTVRAGLFFAPINFKIDFTEDE